MRHKITVIPGDGIGTEVMDACIKVLRSLGGVEFEFVEANAGLKTWKQCGNQVPPDTLDKIEETKIALYGAATTLPGPKTPKSVAVTLRQKFDLYANVRPMKSRRGIKNPLGRFDVDFVVVRENTEGLYAGYEFRIDDNLAIGINKITRKASERIAKYAFELARKRQKKRKVTAVHKANILKESHGLFKEVCGETANEYKDIAYNDLFADAVAMDMIRRPEQYDVIVCTNLIGDILSDEASALVGGLGVAPAGNIGDKYAIFEPIHGSAPDIAGKGIANPMAMVLSAAMMLEHIGETDASGRIERAVDEVLSEGNVLTPDLGGNNKTHDVAEEIIKKLNDV